MSKTCRSCQIRQIATGTLKGADVAYLDRAQARAVELCNLCLVEADYENVHSDDGHDEDNKVDGCWICYPELNQRTAADAKGARQSTGTSRVGMVITVPLRASGKDKAEAVKAQMPVGAQHTLRTVKGITTLKAWTKEHAVKLVWDAQGRFDYDASNGDAKKVRNVAAALRMLAAE